jgi:hypothetical protein
VPWVLYQHYGDKEVLRKQYSKQHEAVGRLFGDKGSRKSKLEEVALGRTETPRAIHSGHGIPVGKMASGIGPHVQDSVPVVDVKPGHCNSIPGQLISDIIRDVLAVGNEGRVRALRKTSRQRAPGLAVRVCSGQRSPHCIRLSGRLCPGPGIWAFRAR